MEMLKKNWKLKLLSLVIAIFLWSYIIYSMNPVVDVRMNDIEIVYENLESIENNGYILNSDLQNSVNVTVAGQRRNLLNLTSQHIRVSANLENLSEGVHTLQLNYSVPEGIALEDYQPSVNVNVDRVISKEMDVQINRIGNLQENYVLVSNQLTPERISIKGARSIVDSVQNLVVDLDLNNLTNNVTVNREIRAIDETGQEVTGITLGQEFVNMNVIVEMQKEVEIKPTIVGEVDPELRLESTSLNRTSVFIQGPPDIINGITSIETQEIDISQMTESGQIPVNLELQDDVRPVNPELEYTLDVQIISKTNKTLSVEANTITVENLPENKMMTIADSQVEIVIHGFAEDIDQINEEDIRLIIDGRNRTNGTHTIKPSVLINGQEPEEGVVQSITSVRVDITNVNTSNERETNNGGNNE